MKRTNTCYKCHHLFYSINNVQKSSNRWVSLYVTMARWSVKRLSCVAEGSRKEKLLVFFTPPRRSFELALAVTALDFQQ